MRRAFLPPSLLLALAALAGCATPYTQGQTALRQERYEAAAGHFAEALARDPGRLDARVGLGVARYKLGALDASRDLLRRVVAEAPGQPEARLYLALTYLQQGETGPAQDELAALLKLDPHPRIAAQIERALGLLRSGPLPAEVRGFVAASLEDEAAWEREVREAERARRVYVEPGGFIYWPPYPHRALPP